MQKILQPYIALDLINVTKDGFTANDNQIGSFSTRSNQRIGLKDRSAGIINLREGRDTSKNVIQPDMGVIKEEVGASLHQRTVRDQYN